MDPAAPDPSAPEPSAPDPAETNAPSPDRHPDLDLDELAAALINTGLLHPPAD